MAGLRGSESQAGRQPAYGLKPAPRLWGALPYRAVLPFVPEVHELVIKLGLMG
jgi:hypothetical protein